MYSHLNQFTDVRESDYFFEAVKWAVRKEIMRGTSETAFSPNAPCTRAHSYIVIELKAEKFKRERLGQLNFYVTAVDKE